MQTQYIMFGDKRYRVDGSKRTGFTVYEMKGNNQIYIGRSFIVETARQAVIEIERNSYSSFY